MTRSISEDMLSLFDGHDLFERLDPDILALFAERGREVRVDPGEMVFREGDPGDMMYFVTSGSVQVLARAFDGTDVVFARLGPGHLFGEQAILPTGTSRRSASVRAVTRCRLLALVREDALEVLGTDSPLVRELREAGEAQRNARRSKLREDVLKHLGLSGRYGIERFEAGQVVCHQGAPGRKVYLVLSGAAEVVRSDGDTDEVLAELLPGLLFGEQAVLHEEFHTASVVATTELETASLDGAWFRDTCAHNPQLRSLVETLGKLYRLPRRGRLRLEGGTLGSHPRIIAVQDLLDGRRVESTCIVGHATFSARVLGAPEATASHRFEDPEQAQLRELHLANDRIIEIESEGDWDQLPEVVALMLDGTPVARDRFASLAVTGKLGSEVRAPEKGDFVCHCARVTLIQLKRAIRSGCETVEQLTAATHVARDCGECSCAIREILGETDWAPARCHHIIPVTEDVRTFQIRPLRGECLPWLPGQHIVLQAQIGGQWVTRPYTLSCAATEQTCSDGRSSWSRAAPEVYEITVKREPKGTMSQWLFDRLRGDSELRISAPTGSFSLANDQTRDVVCLVGGIGLTPALAMARTLAAAPRDFRLFIDYSVSQASQAIYREELEGFYRANPNIRVNLRITERDGRLDEQQVRLVANEYPHASFYLCGRRAYMEAMELNLAKAGVVAARVAALNFRSEADWYAGGSGARWQLRDPSSDAPVGRQRADSKAILTACGP